VSPLSENPEQNRSVREALRRHCLAAREALSGKAHAEASTLIQQALFHFFSTRPVGVLAFCFPLRHEFDPLPLARALHEDGWKLAMPVVVAEDQAMVFHQWTPQCAMKPGAYNIPVPADEIPLLPDTLLVPLVAFDRYGYRLGYGGGYFDRTLADLSPAPTTLGVGFELARVASIFPEAHDRPLDYLVTEAGIVPRLIPGRPGS